MKTSDLKVGQLYLYRGEYEQLEGTYLQGDEYPIYIFKIHERNSFLILDTEQVNKLIIRPVYINSVADLYEC